MGTPPTDNAMAIVWNNRLQDDSPLSRPVRLALIAVFLVLQVVASVGIAMGGAPGPTPSVMMMGIAGAQVNLAALYIGLGTGPTLKRIGIGSVAALIASAAIAFQLGRWEGLASGLILGGMVLAQALLIQVPFVGIRWGTELRVALDTEPEHAEFKGQFRLRQLLLVTAVLAVLMAVARALLPMFPWSDLDLPPVAMVIAVVSVLLGLNLLMPLPIIWAALIRRWAVLWFFLSVVIAAALCYAAHGALITLAGRSGLQFYEFSMLGGGHFAWLMGSLLLLRAAGYRLRRAAES